MADHAGRARLAREVLAFARSLPSAAMSSPAPVRIAAIIPVGTIEGAKTRLGGTLDAEERQDLVEGLLDRTHPGRARGHDRRRPE